MSKIIVDIDADLEPLTGNGDKFSELNAFYKGNADAPPLSNVDATLTERGSRYGTFVGQTKISQLLKAVMADTDNWDALADDQKEALEMIQHKIARILNGNPDYADSWHDVAGYATLIELRLNGQIV